MRANKAKKKKNRRGGRNTFIVFGIITLLCGAYLGFVAPTHTVYSYEIKAQQVYDNDRINESVALHNLSDEEQSLLHDAFKKQDNLLDNSEVVVETRERFHTFDGWRVIEYQGVYILVAIDGPDTRETFSDWFSWVILIVGIVGACGTLIGLKELIFPSPYRV